MTWLKLISRESGIPISRIALWSAAAGACRSGILGTIISALDALDNEEKSIQHLFLFMILVVTYYVLHNYELRKISAEIEDIAHRVRLRIIDKLQRTELRYHDRVPRSAVLVSLNSELPVITRSVVTLFNAIQSATLIVFTFIFIGSMSQTAFMFIFFGAALTVALQLSIFKRVYEQTARLQPVEASLNEVVTDALGGFRETKLNERKRLGVLASAAELSGAVTIGRKEVQRLLSRQLVISQVCYMILVAIVVFVAPKIEPAFHDTILKASISMIFLMGPLNTVVGAIQVLINVDTAAANVMKLEANIDALADEEARLTPIQSWARTIDAIETNRPVTFSDTIAMEGVSFVRETTPERTPFRLGPIDFSFKAGEIVLLTGGNGSGKSTLLQVLLGLYQPSGGLIRVDGTPIGSGNIQQYRELFGVIFADNHLFSRLYGLEAVDQMKLQELLDYTSLTGKTAYRNNRFDTIKLSTGQRKRLALVEMLMEDKPILVFDEWAAEQDPASRARFYNETLPALKERGKTIIAVSHDDAFFHIADLRVVADQGRIASLERKTVTL